MEFESHLEEHFKGIHVKDIMFGVEDGVVTALGTVLGVSAATGNSALVIIAGIAALFAEAISMFFGSYLSSKSQGEIMQREIEREKEAIAKNPRQEISELHYFLKRMGLTAAEIKRIAPRIWKDKKKVLKIMMKEELGLLDDKFENPVRYAAIFWVATMVGIFVVLPFLIFDITTATNSAVAVSLLVLFTTGAAKTKFTRRSWIKSGMEMMMIGVVAAAIGYIVGSVLGVTIA